MWSSQKPGFTGNRINVDIKRHKSNIENGEELAWYMQYVKRLLEAAVPDFSPAGMNSAASG
jgi:hypothetical protein